MGEDRVSQNESDPIQRLKSNSLNSIITKISQSYLSLRLVHGHRIGQSKRELQACEGEGVLVHLGWCHVHPREGDTLRSSRPRVERTTDDRLKNRDHQ